MIDLVNVNENVCFRTTNLSNQIIHHMNIFIPIKTTDPIKPVKGITRPIFLPKVNQLLNLKIYLNIFTKNL
jgi:hypothetical protein